MAGKAIQRTLSATDARVKRAGTFSWAPLNHPDVLYPGDQVKTGASGEVRYQHKDGGTSKQGADTLMEAPQPDLRMEDEDKRKRRKGAKGT